MPTLLTRVERLCAWANLVLGGNLLLQANPAGDLSTPQGRWSSLHNMVQQPASARDWHRYALGIAGRNRRSHSVGATLTVTEKWSFLRSLESHRVLAKA